jgi:hypothetical protein
MVFRFHRRSTVVSRAPGRQTAPAFLTRHQSQAAERIKPIRPTRSPPTLPRRRRRLVLTKCFFLEPKHLAAESSRFFVYLDAPADGFGVSAGRVEDD